jgi:hypothetical protein
VKAVYIDPGQGYQPVDMPEVTNSTYVTNDNSDVLIHDTNFPLVTSGATAQRLSKILLESVRQQIRVTLKLNMNGFQLQVGDNFQLSNTRLNRTLMELWLLMLMLWQEKQHQVYIHGAQRKLR